MHPAGVHGTNLYKEPELSRAATPGEAECLSDDNTSDGSFDGAGDSNITDPLQHLQWAGTLPTPSQTDTDPLSQRQKQNLLDMITNKEEYRSRVVQKLQEWPKRKEQLAGGANATYRSTLDATQQATLGR